jgi:hypothetical protein
VTQVAWHKNTVLFAAEFAKGYGWQMFLGGICTAHGLHVETPPFRLREHISERRDFKDEGDLIVEGYVIEVKSRDLYFTCASDFPYDTIFVDTVRNWAEKKVKSLAYACASQKTHAVIVTQGWDPQFWGQDVQFDNVRKIHDTFYTAKKSDWHDLSVTIEGLKKVSSQEGNSAP